MAEVVVTWAIAQEAVRMDSGCQVPTILSLDDQLRQMSVPTLVIVGDEDDPYIEPAIFMKRRIPRCGLVMLPQSGHTVNLEEPALFNGAVSDFLTAVEAGRWEERDRGSGVSFLADVGRDG